MTSKKKQKKDYTVNTTIGNTISKIYFFLILIYLPLFFNKAFYTAMIRAKATAYWTISGIVLIGIAAYYIRGIITKEYKWKPSFKRWNLIDWSLLLFAFFVSISFFLSKNWSNCLWGNDGFYCGTYMVLSSIIFYFFASRNLSAGQTLWKTVFVVNDVIFAWIYLNTLSIDPFHMHANINGASGYFACLGQMDSVSAYLCLLLPIGIIFFVNETKTSDTIFYGVFCTLALLALFSIQTDGVFIGFAFCGLFLFPYILNHKDRIERLLYLGIIAGMDLLILKMLFLLIPKYVKQDPGISYYMIQYWGGAAIIALCLFLLLLFSKYKEKIQPDFLKVLSIIICIGISAVILGYVFYSIGHFDDRWGNGRGTIWRGSIQVFQEYSIKEKLFGMGTEMIKAPLTQATGWNVQVANSHNNILECVLCLGVLGLIAYLLAWTSIVFSFFKKNGAGHSTEQTAYFMALIAYWGQSIVGNPYSLTVPILFLILTLYRNQIWRAA